LKSINPTTLSKNWKNSLKQQHIPSRITKSLYDDDPHVLSSGARLHRRVSETFEGFVANMTELFEQEKREKKQKRQVSQGSKVEVKDGKARKWRKEDEEVMVDHIREMRVRLAQYSRTAPWKKVMMGAMDWIKKDGNHRKLNQFY
jgi:hypothetical protein